MDMGYDTIHDIVSKNQLHTIVQPSLQPVTQKKTSYNFAYAYNPSGANSLRPHAPNHIGLRTYTYDLDGNQTGWTHDTNGTRRNITWDDENRIQAVFDNGQEKDYKYDDQGQRMIKRGPQGETVYVNQFFTQRPGANGTKHVYAGTTRIASKLVLQGTPNSNPNGATPFEKDIFFYHPDHIGSTNYVTDLNGKLFEHIEYFPFGESWVEENTNQQRTPYLFSAKELDEETGLYYFGARYYDPRTSVWQSADPALAAYLDDGAPALGIRVPQNLALYSYTWNNPVIHRDPDGRVINLVAGLVGAAVGAVVGPAIYAGVSLYKHEPITGRGLAGAAVGGAVTGGVAGLSLGASLIIEAGAAGAGAVYGGVANRAIVTGDVAETFNAEAMQQDFALGVVTYGVVKGTTAAISAARPQGVVYERINPQTGERYVGQAKSSARYAARQGEHNADLGVEHKFNVLGKAKPGTRLDKLEEDFIRQGGGPEEQGGTLANKRYQMSEERYRAAGGKIDKPTE